MNRQLTERERRLVAIALAFGVGAFLPNGKTFLDLAINLTAALLAFLYAWVELI